MKQSSRGRKARGHHAERSDHANAFFPDPRTGPSRAPDDLAEALAEGYLASATSAEEQGEVDHEAPVEEETGGPFVLSSGRREFAHGADPSNPRDAERAPFPTTVGSSWPQMVGELVDDDERSPPQDAT